VYAADCDAADDDDDDHADDDDDHVGVQEFKFPESRELYLKALKKGGDNPVVLRAYAIWLMASCEEPREVNFKRAVDMFNQAAARDPEGERYGHWITSPSVCMQHRVISPPWDKKLGDHVGICGDVAIEAW
jgi:hypothetical protein